MQSFAEALCISQSSLSQLMRECFGDTPNGLINHPVVLEIKALLSHSQLPIGRVAEHLCFEDASCLCRHFRRHTGQSLTGYRRASQSGITAVQTAALELQQATPR
ncbi:helix-turn-helix domain-containing protein [Stenotrophomonas maltophilia]